MNKYSLESERLAPPLRQPGELSLLHAGIGEVPAGAPQWRAGGFRTLLLCWSWRGGLHSLLSTAGSLTNLPDSGLGSGFSLQPLFSLTCLFLMAPGAVLAFVGQTPETRSKNSSECHGRPGSRRPHFSKACVMNIQTPAGLTRTKMTFGLWETTIATCMLPTDQLFSPLTFGNCSSFTSLSDWNRATVGVKNLNLCSTEETKSPTSRMPWGEDKPL